MNNYKVKLGVIFLISIFTVVNNQLLAQTKFIHQGRSIIFKNESKQIRLTPYGNKIIRIQTVRSNEDFFSDDRNEMVESHQWPGNLSLIETDNSIQLSTDEKDGISIEMKKTSMQLSFIISSVI